MKGKKKQEINKNYIIIAVAIVVWLVIGFILIKGGGKKDNNQNNEEVEKIGAKEDDIIQAYGMSKEDAINVVKRIYNSDNYEFSADINNESKYIVTVKNIITEKTSKYVVDPTSNNGTFYELTE